MKRATKRASTATKKKTPATKTTRKAAPAKKKKKTATPAKKTGAPARKTAAPAKKKTPPARKKAAPAKKKVAPKPTLALPSGGVLDILDAENPVDALRELIAARKKKFSIPDGQIALGAAQLMLLTIAREHRGGPEVRDVIDLVVSAWKRFPEPAGFHAQEFLRNALVAAGDDTELVDALLARVPREASPELVTVVARAQTKEIIPVDVAPYVRPVRAAFEYLRATLEELGAPFETSSPAELDAVLATERAARIQLPNDFRALLTITNGCTLFDREFFGVDDYRTETALAKKARDFLAAAPAGLDECIPLANWGQPTDWLLWDPHGHRRRGEPGYVVMLDEAASAYDDLVSVLEGIAAHARDALSTN
ncbi:hypothetical protein BH11MYX2_BH11MYX2_13610 [soil metagenome]